MCDQCKEHNGILPTAAATSPKRLKLWELAEGLHCSIIGTCLTDEDLLGLAKRSRIEIPANAASYEVHSYFAAEAGKAGAVARALAKLLDRRYEGAIRKVSRCLCPDALGALWNGEARAGRVPPAYWAFLSAGHVPASLKTRIFGEVHMLSHVLGRSTHMLAARTLELDRRAAGLAERLHRETDRHASALTRRDAEIARLGGELSRSRRTFGLPVPLSGEAAEVLRPRDRRRLDRRERALVVARERARAAEAHVLQLEKRLQRMRSQPIRRTIAAPTCPAADVCNAIVEADRRRILYL
ncbi:MAG: hypothetical protein ACREC6_07900, partial [Hyphomicrobiaceae bacterium]